MECIQTNKSEPNITSPNVKSDLQRELKCKCTHEQIHIITGCAESVKFLFLKKIRSHVATIKVKLLEALSYMKEIFIKQNIQYTFTLIGMVQQKIKFKTAKRSKVSKNKNLTR